MTDGRDSHNPGTVLKPIQLMFFEYSLPGEKGIVAEGGEVHIRTPNGDTSFRIAGDKAELRTRKLKSLSEKREYEPRIRLCS